MKFIALFAAVLSTLAVTAAQKPDLGELITADIESIKDAVVILNHTIGSFNTGILQLETGLRIRSQALAIRKQIMKTVNDTKNSGSFSDQNSQNIALAVAVDLFPPLNASLSGIVDKKPVFTTLLGTGDLTLTVRELVRELRHSTQNLANKLVPRFTDEIQQIAPDVINTIIGTFNTTLDAYPSCSGKVCLPAIPDDV